MCLADVATAEHVGVIENVVEVVEGPAHAVAGVQWPGGVVGVVEGPSETAEELGHGDLRLPVPVVGGGVVDHRPVPVVVGKIPAPEVAVDQARHGIVIHERGKLFQQFFSQFQHLSAEAVAGCQVQLEAEPLFPPEHHPLLFPVVGLVGGADGVAAVPAESIGRVAVEGGKLFACRGHGLSGAAPEGDVLHDDVALPGVAARAERAGNADGAGVRHLLQAQRLGFEHVEPVGAVELHEPVLVAVGEMHGGVDAAASQGAG